MSATTEQDLGSTFWETLGDGLTAFSEKAATFLTRVLGDSNERHIRSLGYHRAKRGEATPTVKPGSLLDRVNQLEEKVRALSNEEIKALTPVFRARLAQGESLDDLLPEAFAACREAGRRAKNMRHFDVQILGGIVLHRGNIAEMVTGEGKTLVATLPAYLNALEGKGVHVVTVNDYLARRDCEWMLPIYQMLGITAGYIQSDMDPVARRRAYDCDITYGTNSEFGFDYLRDNMKPARWGDPAYDPFYHQVQKNLHYAIIDEVDNILIDEARTPLIISGPAFTDVRRYGQANDIAIQLAQLQEQEPGKYFEVKEKEHTCHLTDEGIRKAEELAGVDTFYTAGNMEWPHLIDNALKGHHLYKRDKNYMVMRNPESGELAIIIVDEFTGRPMFGRQWSDGLHQAVEAKHARDGVKIKEETQTLATITLQNFFKLYKKLAGMTGTAMTEANEFWKIYKLDVIAIPTNKALIRLNAPDMIFRTGKEKWDAIVDEVAQVNEEGRPILIGTTDVAKSEKLSAMLKRRGIKHELLNAKPEYVARESEIVAQAGRIGAVTIATNMAGRGTDIILGGNPETLAWARLKDKYASRLDVPEEEWKQLVEEIETREKMKEEGRKVAEMGGLHIVGTERHESRRIDNQLRGRAGRQGDPGSSRFFLALDDDLMRIFAGEFVQKALTWMGMEEGQSIESKMVSRRIEGAQKKVEERNFDIRKNLLEYDEVMDYQRKKVYSYRQEILEGTSCRMRIVQMLDEQIQAAVERFLDDDYGPATFAEFASKRLGVELDGAEFSHGSFHDSEQTAKDKACRMIPTQIHEAMEENLSPDVEEREWNWRSMSQFANTRWGLNTTDRQLKQLGRDEVATFLIEQAEAAINAIDLSEGAAFLESDWGLRSIADWARLKFGIRLEVDQLKDKQPSEIQALLHQKFAALYRQKEIEFPVRVGMARFMSDRSAAPMGGHRYDREGLYRWTLQRFGALAAGLTEDDFRTQSRGRLQEILTDLSRRLFPQAGHEDTDARIEESFSGTSLSEAEDAREVAEWVRSNLGLEVSEATLTNISQERARQLLWNAYDAKFRPEMARMERGLLLSRLDAAWKSHLYTMDHLRSTIGLRSYAQLDAKTEYKREGMKEFDTMWEGVQDKVTEAVFRMEEDEGFQETLWTIGTAVHETAGSTVQQAASEASMRAQQNGAITNGPKGDKKPEPIRNRGDRVGRNDPCPCGSGKKYKNCHMRQAV